MDPSPTTAQSAETGPRLEWAESPGRPEFYQLHSAPVLIGRRSDCDIVLGHRLVSRQHARILPEQGFWAIIDLQSSHGTWVNGERVERRELRPNDTICFGEHGLEIRFTLDKNTTPPTAPSLLETPAVDLSMRRLARVLPDNEAAAHSELEKISCLLEFHYNFGQAYSPEKTFHHILRSALQISGAERGFILRRFVPRKEKPGFVYALGLDGQGLPLRPDDFKTSHSAVDQVTRTGEPVFMTQGIEGNFAGQASIVAMNLRALACLPLECISQETGASEVMGILYLDSHKRMHSLSGLDKKLLIRLAGDAGSVLEKLGNIEARAERQRIEQELAMAEETQRTLLPGSLPSFKPFIIRAFCRPTRQLGGDFYDFIHSRNELVCVLADVSGKGIPAALLSSLSLGAINMEFRSSGDPSSVLGSVNQLLCGKTPPNRFVTLFLCQFSASGEGRYINAGHTAFVYRRGTGALDRLESSCLPLGVFPSVSYDSLPLMLSPGDVLVVYSDGLTDAENEAGEDFGEEQLEALIRSAAPQGCEVLESSLLAGLDRFTKGTPQTDDITFLLIENRLT